MANLSFEGTTFNSQNKGGEASSLVIPSGVPTNIPINNPNLIHPNYDEKEIFTGVYEKDKSFFEKQSELFIKMQDGFEEMVEHDPTYYVEIDSYGYKVEYVKGRIYSQTALNNDVTYFDKYGNISYIIYHDGNQVFYKDGAIEKKLFKDGTVLLYKDGKLHKKIMKGGHVLKYTELSSGIYQVILDGEDIDFLKDAELLGLPYGADQVVFKDFDRMITDKYIMNEMQKYYPTGSFASDAEAYDFYDRWFRNIANTGCGYAAAADIIFDKYKGRESLFYNTFGFPMYTYDEGTGKIKLNYECLALKYFNFCWANKNTIDEYEKGESLNSNGDNSEDGICTAAELSELGEFLEVYNVDVTCDSTRYIDFDSSDVPIKFDDILLQVISKELEKHEYIVYGGGGWDLYDKDGNLVKIDGDGHYMLITGIENGKVVVTSWGKKYYLDTTTISEDGEIWFNFDKFDFINRRVSI